jgi:methionine-rich copper-binding protein CopC
MLPRVSLAGVFALLLILRAFAPAEARPLHVRESFPQAEAILDGRNAQYVVRFDGLVDHAASRLEITQDGKVVQSLHPLLDSAPDVLFASAEALAPGRYELHWYAKSPDGDFSDGVIPFSVP